MLSDYVLTIPECETVSVTYKTSEDAKSQTEVLGMKEIIAGKAIDFLKSNIELALINAFVSIGFIEIKSLDKKTNKKIFQWSFVKDGHWKFMFVKKGEKTND